MDNSYIIFGGWMSLDYCSCQECGNEFVSPPLCRTCLKEDEWAKDKIEKALSQRDSEWRAKVAKLKEQLDKDCKEVNKHDVYSSPCAICLYMKENIDKAFAESKEDATLEERVTK